jgi:Zn-dependent peptidase ImmA (M78 family)
MIRVDVRPDMLRWARERASLGVEALTKRFPHLADWERGDARPTLKQLERFASTTHVPIGILFLPTPPVERVPIPDFRTRGNERIDRPSPELLDTIYACQRRQEWYRNFARSMGEEALPFVGSTRRGSDVVASAAVIRQALGYDVEARRRMSTWTDALRAFIGQADALGILVMCSGVVGNDTHRPLDPEEFCGFALPDGLAPLVFINGADTKNAQMFTLAHELAHVWLGESALSDSTPMTVPDDVVESWCNRVAAELLVPLDALRETYDLHAELPHELDRLTRWFKVSSLVILRRMHDAGGLTREEFWHEYRREVARLRAIPRRSGGSFYLTQSARVSKRFARALVASTLEGNTLERDALQMLAIRKLETLHEFGRTLGVEP